MTLIIGMVCKGENGKEKDIILASDTWASVGDLRFRESKIFQVEGLPLVMGGAGVGGLVKEIYLYISQKLRGFFAEQKDFLVGNLREFIPKIGDDILTVTKYYKDREDLAGSFPMASMILAATDITGDVILYSFDSWGLPNRCDFQPGYVIKGSGMGSGGVLLLNEYYPVEDIPTLDDAAELAAYIIALVSGVDASVGGYPDFYLLSKGEVKRVTEEVKENINKLVVRRREALRKLWFDLSKSEVALKTADRKKDESS